MRRLLVSVIIGMAVGVAAGFIIGWGIAPVRYVDSPLNLLAEQPYQDEYAVMVAAAYAQTGDLEQAIERLRPLDHPNIPSWVQEVTERYISRGRSVADITDLVALAEALGRLTPAMEPYRIPATPSPGAD